MSCTVTLTCPLMAGIVAKSRHLDPRRAARSRLSRCYDLRLRPHRRREETLLRRTAGPYMWASSGRLQRTRVWERDEARMLRLANEAHRGVPNDHKFIANPPEVGIEIIADVRRHQPAAHAVSISWNAPRFPATVGHTRLREMQKRRMRHLLYPREATGTRPRAAPSSFLQSVFPR
jgi:hypothetical protein